MGSASANFDAEDLMEAVWGHPMILTLGESSVYKIGGRAEKRRRAECAMVDAYDGLDEELGTRWVPIPVSVSFHGEHDRRFAPESLRNAPCGLCPLPAVDEQTPSQFVHAV